MRRLRYEEFVEDAPDIEGEYIMTHHEDCDNGIDHKKRLWIKRNIDGTINAYCHNCQAKGFYRPKEIIRTPCSMRLQMDVTQNNIQLPNDFKAGVDNIPSKGLVWLYTAGLTKEEVDKYGFGWSSNSNRLIIPIYSSTNKLAFFQGRSLDVQSNPPKYLTIKDNSQPAFFLINNFPKGDIVVTEDILSAIRCGRVKNSISTLGVGMSDYIKHYLASLGDRVILFYDYDNSQVRSTTMSLKRDLDNFMSKETIIIKTDRDPKEYTDIQLKDLLESL